MKKIIALLFFFPFLSFAQVQIGQDIDAEAQFDFFGFSTSMSSDGQIVAIGAPFNDSNGSNSGHVRVLENQDGTWVQIGEDIVGENAGDNTGRSVSLSADGNIIAIGAEKNDENGFNSGHVRIFENQNGNWVQLGEDINGQEAIDLFGTSVSLSEDGNTVAVGAPGNDGGYVKVFSYQEGAWIQIGENIQGEGNFDQSGVSISLSSNGNVLAIGAEFNSDNGIEAGHARIFENQNDSWVQIGEDIDGTSAGDFFGKALALSGDGSTIAVSSGGNASNLTDAGYVQVFENQNSTWVQVGNDIIGEAEGDIYLSSSNSLALSAGGNILAIGARHNDGNGESSGHVRIFSNTDGVWEQIGEDIDGEAEGDQSGHSVAFSSSGDFIAIGARDNEGTGPDAGHVRVFGLSEFVSTTSNLTPINFIIYPNPASDQISIQLENIQIFKQASIYNNIGQRMLKSFSNRITTSDLSTGLYSIEIETSQGTYYQKIIIQ